MRVSVFGLGYVGCVAAACMAKDGHTVIGVDVNESKVDDLVHGRSPIREPGLAPMLRDAAQANRLTATTDTRAAVHNSEVSVICVGTPSNGNGSLKLDYLENVCREIGAALPDCNALHVIVVRSTVLPGTLGQRLIPLLEEFSGLRAGRDFGVCMNPEFLRETSAIDDYYHPSYIVIGASDARSATITQQLYADIDAPIIHTSAVNAEMLKYVCNAFHALKIAFANEVGNLCKALGTDGREVMELFCRDVRLNISTAYLRPGFGFGGSCLPKDLRALIYRAKERDVECQVLRSVLQSNQEQIRRGIELVENTGRNKIGVLGLTFKSGTDDVRESPVVPLVETLVGRGYQVQLYDRDVDLQKLVGANKFFVQRAFPHIASLIQPSISDVVDHSDVIVVANGDPEFRTVPQRMRRDQILIDLIGVAKKGDTLTGAYEGICW